ncbi:polymer-forming cytoskeletal protein [Erythrobacter arachoides]|uniref:Polymer-forming cytoskeletal protein n=1 Tax=Aurantiacibacter arachoides TaxID=1850444 RepID=A0A845A4S7_9SPHN|nr:polymer-forming cytoskeletal protein [Aurantiacibacter arachoides]MXO94680.1 polymer-forming cytoskeletal protein [Aurantiacibacter arachoides]GGD61525.1 hypothetical protein GCM10011411_22230 [Aurantiacibacter arachoides]
MANGSTFSVIGPDVTIRGNIEATVDLHVDGQVIGDIACASLVQGEGSRVEGEIKAETARLSGHVTGRIEARNLVVLKSARIEGDVSYETLTIEQGATVDGRFAPLGKRGNAGGAQAQAQAARVVADSDQDAQRKMTLAA